MVARELECVGCGTRFPFDPSRPNKRRCQSNCHRQRSNVSANGARRRKQEAHDLEFIGVDGEGVNCDQYVEVWDDEEDNLVIKRVKGHQYVLLSVGDQSLHNNGEQLHHEEIFEFLWQQYLEHPNAVFVGFFLGYDFCHWLRTLPEGRAWKLLHKDGIASRRPRNRELKFPWPVRCGPWEFDILGAKRFKLRPYIRPDDIPTRVVTHKDGTQSVERVTRPWMYINDTGSFFQSAFLSAIDPKGWDTPILTDAEYDIIRRGKEERASATLDTEMIRYNVLENDVLARLMAQVNAGFVADGIKLNRSQWFGPGQAAQRWLANVGCPPGELVREVVPEWARDAARESYYGGWFEIMMHGLVTGTTYGYDINSAYPYAISTLPCLLHGAWTRGSGPPGRLSTGSYRLVNAEVIGRNAYIGAMPHRSRDGSILRPHRTAGWYWWHELQAAKRAKLVSRIKVTEWVEYRPCACDPPLAGVADLYEGRLQVGKNSPFGKSKKLVYNSAYGKLAQSIGMPKFTNAIYASMITARCRTMILNAIATHPNKSRAVAMVATDSVTFLTPHPTLECHPTKLGAWDGKEHHNLTLMMPGLYWDDESRQAIREGQRPKVKSRGVPARDLAKVVDKLDQRWAEFIGPPVDRELSLPVARIPITFGMISAKMAITRDRWRDCGKVIFDGYREISGDMRAKRRSYYVTGEDGRGARIMRSSVWPEVDGEPRSYPYDKAFGEEVRLRNEEDLLTPDGPLMQELAQAIVPR